MAIEKTVITPQGFESVNAYHQVNNLCLISKNEISFCVQSFKSKDSLIAFASEQYACLYDLSGNNPIAQAYNHIKTLSEFVGAKDC
jgi:hypothetical protein